MQFLLRNLGCRIGDPFDQLLGIGGYLTSQYDRIEPLSIINHCGFVWTRVHFSEAWLCKTTIRRCVMMKLFDEVT